MRAAAFTLATGHAGEVDAHLVDAPILHQRRDLGSHVFEQARAKRRISLKPSASPIACRHRLAAFAMPTAQPMPNCRAGGGGDDPWSYVLLAQRKLGCRDAAQRPFAVAGQLCFIDLAPAAANCHSQAFELWAAQQIHRGEEGAHVEMGDAADF